ncbi:hypothetical protein VP01_663g5 [Puccinia sorghi]|uniref:Uncharacterized protein n=1 Tax=Puccinia sorghi TaxID=27349 RepID=A0A0L6UF00_9BASI|nr:hypothetical protein VP01_663g5 [Puccinia sorghi]
MKNPQLMIQTLFPTSLKSFSFTYQKFLMLNLMETAASGLFLISWDIDNITIFLCGKNSMKTLRKEVNGTRKKIISETQNPLLFPAPQVLTQWQKTAIPEALAWEEIFTNCFQVNMKLKAKSGPNKNKYYRIHS